MFFELLRNIAPFCYLICAILVASTGKVNLNLLKIVIKFSAALFITIFILFSIISSDIILKISYYIYNSETSYPDYPSDFSGILAIMGFIFWFKKN